MTELYQEEENNTPNLTPLAAGEEIRQAIPENATLSTWLPDAVAEVLRNTQNQEDVEVALTFREILETLRNSYNNLDELWSVGGIRTILSRIANDETSPIARRAGRQGYYLRNLLDQENIAPEYNDIETMNDDIDNQALDAGRDGQPEEIFRALYLRHQEIEGKRPKHIEHLNGTRRMKGVNSWKFPDVVTLVWDPDLVNHDEPGPYANRPGYDIALHPAQGLRTDSIEIKKSLGEQPFFLQSVELKVQLDLGLHRQNFFQCVSNSSWAHEAHLVVAIDPTDETLRNELIRLGNSFGIAITTYGIPLEELRNLNSAQSVLRMSDEQIASFIDESTNITEITPAKRRESLDWKHVDDLKRISSDFLTVFEFASFCLMNGVALSYDQYKLLRP